MKIYYLNIYLEENLIILHKNNYIKFLNFEINNTIINLKEKKTFT